MWAGWWQPHLQHTQKASVRGVVGLAGWEGFSSTCLWQKKREAIDWQVVYGTCWGEPLPALLLTPETLKAAKERCESHLLLLANCWSLWRAGCQLHHCSESRYLCGSGNLRCCAARGFRDSFGHLVNNTEGQCCMCLRKQCSFPPSCPLHFASWFKWLPRPRELSCQSWWTTTMGTLSRWLQQQVILWLPSWWYIGKWFWNQLA